MPDNRELKMSVDLSVIEHLGMNLYSNTPAVLSEIVANSWDADAKNVWIEIDSKTNTISIRDDGIGMSRNQVIDQYLAVGFRRREQLGVLTEKFKRQPMGRKGIGKLSCFSIAETICVYTSQANQHTSFRLNSNAIRESLSEGTEQTYKPEELHEWIENFDHTGTCVVLSDLIRSTNQASVKHLRQRVARRFSVLGDASKFSVFVNGERVLISDRGYLSGLEFLWTYGDNDTLQQQFAFDSLTNIKQCEDRTEALEGSRQENEASVRLRGWLGTVQTPSLLKDEGGQNLNRIAIFMRGKMAQDDILQEFSDKRLYADYLVGEIYCDELDDDSERDIATSNRQDLKLDDPRFVALQKLIGAELKHIQAIWSDLRIKEGNQRLIKSIPEVTDWLAKLQGDTQEKAQRWIGRLNLIRPDKDSTRQELLKASILAFESYRRREKLDFLAQIKDEDIEQVLQVFDEIDELQLSYYGQIVKLRLAVVETLQKKLDEDDYEKALQKHIYDHLWLIDPSWERVAGTEVEEKTIGNFLDENTKQLSDKEKRARIDIGYRTASGRHVIIELKRNSVSVPVDDLTAQIRKYRDGARDLISRSTNKDWPLEIICLVGKPPPEWKEGSGREDVEESLSAVDARIVFYAELLTNAHQAYRDYLELNKKIDPLWKIFHAIENFGSST